jgi:limonene-1,2-epoxide hydrolase
MTDTASQNEQIIRNFISDWAGLDASALATYFTDDGVYYNMPVQPVAGRDNVEKFIAGFISSWTATDWELLNIVAAGNIVIAERVDRTKTTAGDVDLPCVGVFEMVDGKIKVWRDYFDMATYTSAMQA